jgi:hypothetical protein
MKEMERLRMTVKSEEVTGRNRGKGGKAAM